MASSSGRLDTRSCASRRRDRSRGHSGGNDDSAASLHLPNDAQNRAKSSNCVSHIDRSGPQNAKAGATQPTSKVAARRSPIQAPRLLYLSVAHPHFRDPSLPRQQPAHIPGIGVHRARLNRHGDCHDLILGVPTHLQVRGRCRRAYGSARNCLLLIWPYTHGAGRPRRRQDTFWD